LASAQISQSKLLGHLPYAGWFGPACRLILCIVLALFGLLPSTDGFIERYIAYLEPAGLLITTCAITSPIGQLHLPVYMVRALAAGCTGGCRYLLPFINTG
jgi:hypothetical protein